jgi:hypothetical protein
MSAARTFGPAGRRQASPVPAVAVLVVVTMLAGVVLVVPAGSAVTQGSPAVTAASSGASPAASGGLTVTPVSPASANIDPGESVKLVGNATGGTPPYTYQWYAGNYPQCAGDILENGKVGSSSATLVVSAAYGNAYYCYTAVDSKNLTYVVSPSAAANVTVKPGLSAGPITPSSLTIDNGTTLKLVAHPFGGVSPYTVNWTSTTTGSSFCTILALGTGSTWSAKPTVNTSYCYTVTDASVGTPAASNTSAPMLVTVDPALVAGKPTPASPTVDSGQSILLSAAPSGGTGLGTYAIQWYSYAGSTTSCSASLKAIGTNSTAILPTVNSTTTYCYSLKDSSYNGPTVFSSTDTVTASSKLAPGAITPSSPLIDIGESLTLKAPTPTSGTSPYTYQWYYAYYPTCSAATATPVVGQTNTTFVTTPGGSEYVCYSVTDSAASRVTAFSAVDLVQVNPALGAGPISPLSPTIDNGSSLKLTANPTEGTPLYKNYQWYAGTNSTCAGDSAVSGATASTYTASPHADTFYCYSASDSSQGTPLPSVVSSTDEVVVNSKLVASAIAPASPTIDKGQSVLLTANPSGGTPVYTFQWFNGTPKSCSNPIYGATSSTYLAHPSSNATFCYSLSDGSASAPTLPSALDTVTVEPAFVAGIATPAAPEIDSGQALTLTSAVSGGKPTYTYQWYSGSSSNCSLDTTLLGTTASQVVSPQTATDYCYRVTDAAYSPQQLYSPVDLVSVGPELLAGSVTSNSTVMDDHQSANLTANPSGGVLPYSFHWYEGTSSSCANDNTTIKEALSAAKITVRPDATTYICYVVGDSSPGTPAASSSSLAYELIVNPALDNHVPNPSAPTIDQGHYVVLSANVTGGTPPYFYAWYSSATSTCAANSTKIAGADGPTYNVTPRSTTYFCVHVTDSSTGFPIGSQFSPADQVTVNIPPPPTFLGLPVMEGIIVLAVLIGIFALIGFFIYRRIRRGRKRGPATDFL